jgi:hypothetical protein
MKYLVKVKRVFKFSNGNEKITKFCLFFVKENF